MAHCDESALDVENPRISDDEGLAHTTRTPTSRPQQRSQALDKDDREAALKAELAGVQNINRVIEGVIGSLDKAKANMESVASAVNNANKLLNLWIRILSQTEHTQRLILNGHWEGASRDIADIEAEAIAKVNEAERRREGERERAAAKEREKAAAAAAREAAEARPPSRSGRGSSSGHGRVKRVGTGGSSAGGATASSTSSGDTARGRGRGLRRGTGRTGSGIGRGVGRGVK